MAPGSGFCQTPPSLLELPGDPEGPRKSIKNWLFAKKCVPNVLFLTFFVQISVSLVFVQDFVSIFHKKLMENPSKNRRIFLALRCFFPTWRPSRNSVFYGTKATFSFFEFLYFSDKTFKKTMPKCREQVLSRESPENGPRGPILAPKMLPNSRRRCLKSGNWSKKVVFWPSLFSTDFFDEKNEIVFSKTTWK